MTEAYRIRLAKLVDESAGRLLIRAFLWSWPSHHQTDTETVKRILFIKFWGIGSVVLTEPALHWLRQAYPDAEIHYLTFSKNAPLLRLIPAVSRIHTLPFHTLGSFAAGCFALLPRLRRECYDLILDGEFFCNFSGLVSYLAAPRARIIGFARPGSCKSRLQSVSIPFLSERHVASQFLSLARAATLNSLSVKGFQTTPSVRMPDARDKRLGSVPPSQQTTLCCHQRECQPSGGRATLAPQRFHPAGSVIASKARLRSCLDRKQKREALCGSCGGRVEQSWADPKSMWAD